MSKIREVYINVPNRVNKRLSELQLFYKGIHNISYVGIWDKKFKIQIRVPINNYVAWDSERNFFAKDGEIFYYKNGVMVKKWVEGKNLVGSIPLNKETQLKLVRYLKEFWKKHLHKKVLNFEWELFWISDQKYFETLLEIERLQESFLVMHGDLNPKNILLTEEGSFKFVDFEFTRRGSKYFDAISLFKDCGVERELLLEELDLEEEIFEKYLYLFKVFEAGYYKSLEYKSKFLDSESQNASNFWFTKFQEELGWGLREENFVLLQKQSFCPEIIFEDERHYLLKWLTKINWFQSPRQLKHFVEKTLKTFKKLNLRGLPTLIDEILRLEKETQDREFVRELIPFREAIWRHIKRVDSLKTQPVFSFLSPQSFLNANRKVKLLGLDSLIEGPTLLNLAALLEFFILPQNYLFSVEQQLIKQYGGQMVSSAKIVILYLYILKNASIDNFLVLEKRIPRFLKLVVANPILS